MTTEREARVTLNTLQREIISLAGVKSILPVFKMLDTYARAERARGELAGHVGACRVLIDTGDGNSYCGEDGAYCPKHPRAQELEKAQEALIPKEE